LKSKHNSKINETSKKSTTMSSIVSNFIETAEFLGQDCDHFKYHSKDEQQHKVGVIKKWKVATKTQCLRNNHCTENAKKSVPQRHSCCGGKHEHICIITVPQPNGHWTS